MEENRTPLKKAYEQIYLAQIALIKSKEELEKFENLEKAYTHTKKLNDYHRDKLNLIGEIVDKVKDNNVAIDYINRVLESTSYAQFEQIKNCLQFNIRLNKQLEDKLVKFLRKEFGDAVVIRPVDIKEENDEKAC